MKLFLFALLATLTFSSIVDSQETKSEFMVKRTRELWTEFNSIPRPSGSASQQVESIQKAVRQLNTKDCDPAMIKYFEALDSKYSEAIPLLRSWELDIANGARAAQITSQRAAQKEAEDKEEACKGAYQLGLPCFIGESDGSASSARAAKSKWRPMLEQLQAKFDPIESGLLRSVEINHNIDYYSSIYDKEANTYWKLGRNLASKDKCDEAIRPLKIAVDINPDHLWVHQTLGNCYAERQKFDLAILEFQKHLEIGGAPKLALLYLGTSYMKLGRFDEAIPHLKKAISLDPDNASSHNNLGVAFQKTNENQDAIAEFLTAIKLSPKFPNPRQRLGETYLAIGNRQAAILQYQELLKIDSERAAALLILIDQSK